MSVFCHGDKIVGKLKNEVIPENKQLLYEIEKGYKDWKEANLAITGTSQKDIESKVLLFNEYKKFLSQSKFRKWATAQAKFHSSVLEEFMYYLCKDIPGVDKKGIHLGPIKGCMHMVFPLLSIDTPEKSPCLVANSKDIDFAIFIEIEIQSKIVGSKKWHTQRIFLPIVFIECKIRFDKTMFIGIDTDIRHIKENNPNCLSLVVTEGYFIGKDFDPRNSSINQIYVLKPGGDSDTIISSEPILDMVKKIETHMSTHSISTIEERIKRGIMI
jgi:hypothetical protein